mmetsp:Transcript_1326/g.4134  ORF Transcript_1326/g.4134 Transcript_1326/m.4134 type:complete len:698 (-) Transcript_1326:1606-3699(-)
MLRWGTNLCSLKRAHWIKRSTSLLYFLILYVLVYKFYLLKIQNLQSVGINNSDGTKEGKCNFVLSSYVWLPDDKRLQSGIDGSLMHLLCTYLYNIISSHGSDIDLRLIGWNSRIKFDGFVSKVRAIKELADSLEADTILMMTDAFDVLIQKQVSCIHIRTLLQSKFKGKMVFVGERQCYPLSRRKYAKGKACNDYPISEGDNRSRYLNGGSWVGFVKDVSTACKIFLENFYSWKKEHFKLNDYQRIVTKLPSIQNSAGQDQYGFAIMYLYGKAQIIAIDTLSEIFITSSGYLTETNSSRTLTTADGFQFDTVTKQIPAVIHYNAGKLEYLRAVKLLPWMRNKDRLLHRDFSIKLGPDLDNPNVSHTEFKDFCPAESFLNLDKSFVVKKTSNFIANFTNENLFRSLNVSFLLSIFETEYCGFLVRECVQLGTRHRLTSLKRPPELAYYNASVYNDFPTYLDISKIYSLIPSIPKNAWGSCAFIASGSIRSSLGSMIDSHDTVVRISATRLSEFKLYRGCKTDVLLVKPHRKMFDNDSDPCKQELKFYWEPSAVYTYGNPGRTLSQKKKYRNNFFLKLKENVPVIRTIVDYGENDKLSPPYPLSDRAATYVERLFDHISVLSGTRIVPTSGFRFLVQLILSRRCRSLSAFGFSGMKEGVYFRSNSSEKVNDWHNPEIEHSILKLWSDSNKLSYKFKLFS